MKRKWISIVWFSPRLLENCCSRSQFTPTPSSVLAPTNFTSKECDRKQIPWHFSRCPYSKTSDYSVLNVEKYSIALITSLRSMFIGSSIVQVTRDIPPLNISTRRFSGIKTWIRSSHFTGEWAGIVMSRLSTTSRLRSLSIVQSIRLN